MKNKSILLFVCLVLLVFGFTFAFAQNVETVTTISLKTGSLLAEYGDVGKILDIAALRIHSMPEGYGAFVLSLSDTDAVQALIKMEQDGVYVQSGALGQQPLYFTWDDIQEFTREQMEAYADMQPMDMPYDMDMMQAVMDGSLTDEQVLGMMGIDEELLAYVSDIQSKQVTETGSFTLDGSDAANQKTVTALTNEDLTRALELPFVQDQLSNQMQTAYPEYSQEEIDSAIKAQMAEAKQAIESSKITVTSTLYNMDDEFVALLIEINGEIDVYSGGTIPISISATVTRTTIETAKFYQLSVILSQGEEEFLNQYGSLYLSDAFVSGQYVFYIAPDEPLLEAMLNCDRSQAGHTTGELALSLHQSDLGDAQSAFIVFDQSKTDNVTDTAIDVFAGGSLDAIKKALGETSLITVKLHTVTQPDSGFFTTLQNATPETSVQLLQMNEEELDGYMQEMEQGLTMTILTVIDNLPADIRDALMQGMGGF